ncbi:MAG: hypothetical protein KF819_36290 [Labilithrix sp.]|nr:hypothetical protein [Labilithrix sp.]
MSTTRKWCLAAIGGALAIYAAVVIRDFSGPIGDHVESFLYEYLSYYVSKNLTFTPLPHLALENDQVFFPFGTNQALQSFCVERDLLFTLLARLFGRGPWLQLYYLGGLVVAAYGTWGLLRKDHGDVRAALSAIIAICFNFYGAQKYPYHFNMACVHWTTLAIVCDFVIVERLVMRRRISLALVLVRVLLLVLGFGLELGHVVGYGLTSLLAVCVFTAALLAVRARKKEPSALSRFVKDAREEVRTRGRLLAAIFAATLFFGVLYGSIVTQIVIASRKYDFEGVALGVWWSQPVRLLIPYFPWIHPSQQPKFLRVWQDQAEVGIGSGGAGLFLLLLAILGLYQAKDRLRYLPLFVVFVMFVVSRPGFDLVRWMPWFAFTRVLSRATVIYSTVLGLFALGVSLDRLHERAKKPLLAVLGALGALELYTFGTIKMSHPAFAFDDRFMAHMKKIEALPGEAVLDFPFCILGGNGDAAYLCPFVDKLKSVYALQRFHHKKVIGQYLGRVHPLQTKPFVDQGWPKVWDTDADDPLEADKQIRCLSDREWEMFTAFYEKNDFAGIQLATDRLPAGCAEQFYARFGAPMGEVSIPKAGRLAFIPRDPAIKDKLDPEGGKSVRLTVELTTEAQIVRRKHPVVVDESGISGWEWTGDAKRPTAHWRWALAPKTELAFNVTEPRTIVVLARFRTPLPRQVVTITLDGTPLETWIGIDKDRPEERSLRFVVDAGRHTLTLAYAQANAGPTLFAPNDPRPLAIMLESLVLRPDPPPN